MSMRAAALSVLSTRGAARSGGVLARRHPRQAPLRLGVEASIFAPSGRVWSLAEAVKGARGRSSGADEASKDIRRDVLEASLKHVHRWGWSEEALAAGAKDLGHSPMLHGIFPRGGIELVEHVQDMFHEEWAKELEGRSSEEHAFNTTGKLLDALKLRLLKHSDHMGVWPQALALQALPQNAPAAFANLARTSDTAWTFAGDRAVNASWYTKRAMLGGIYMASEVYMLTDYSPNFEDTFAFTERQLKEVQSTGAKAGLLFQQVEMLLQAALQSMKDGRQK